MVIDCSRVQNSSYFCESFRWIFQILEYRFFVYISLMYSMTINEILQYLCTINIGQGINFGFN